MKTITIQYRSSATNHAGQDIGGSIQEWGTERDGGVFSRKRDGSWQQHTGTAQTPTFRSPAQFRDYLRSHFEIRDARITGQDGW